MEGEDNFNIATMCIGTEGCIFATGHSGGVVVVGRGPSTQNSILTGSFHRQVWAIASREPIWEVKGHNEYVRHLAFANSDTILVSASEKTHVWKVETGALLHTFDQKLGSLVGFPHHPAFFATCRQTVFGRVCDAEHGGFHELLECVDVAAVVPEGPSLITYSGGNLEDFFIRDPRPLVEQWGRGSVTEVPDGTSLITGSLENVDLASPRPSYVGPWR